NRAHDDNFTHGTNLLMSTAHSSASRRQSIRVGWMRLLQRRLASRDAGHVKATLREMKCHRRVIAGCAKQVRNSPFTFFFLFALTREKSIPLLAALQRRWSTSIGSAGKRNPRQSNKQRQHTRGTPKRASPEVFSGQYSCGFSRTLKFLRIAVFWNTMTRRRWI